MGDNVEALTGADDFDLELVIEIGEQGKAGKDLYYTRLISVAALARLVAAQSAVTGRYMIVMERFSLPSLRAFIQRLCDLSYDSNEAPASERLSRFLCWEHDPAWVPFSQ